MRPCVLLRFAAFVLLREEQSGSGKVLPLRWGHVWLSEGADVC